MGDSSCPARLWGRWRGRRGAGHGQRGAAAVEFALLLPLLMALLVGVIDVALALYDKAVLTQASREGARFGVVLRSPKPSVAEITDVVLQRAQPQLLSLQGGGTPQVTVRQSTPAAYPNTLEVSVQYTFQGVALGSLMQSLGQAWVIHATTVMVHE